MEESRLCYVVSKVSRKQADGVLGTRNRSFWSACGAVEGHNDFTRWVRDNVGQHFTIVD